MNIGSTNIKTFIKRINYQLTANFFTIDEFKILTDRKAKKVIKLIAKINNIKLNKAEVINIVSFIKEGLNLKRIRNSKIKSISKVWKFINVDLEYAKDRVKTIVYKTIKIFKFWTYRFYKYDLLII